MKKMRRSKNRTVVMGVAMQSAKVGDIIPIIIGGTFKVKIKKRKK